MNNNKKQQSKQVWKVFTVFTENTDKLPYFCHLLMEASGFVQHVLTINVLLRHCKRYKIYI